MKKALFLIIVLSVFFLFMGGCSILESRVARWTTDFNTLSSDNRILYEGGAEKLAAEAALHLDNAIRDVESKQLGEFTEPVKVYVFATPKSFSKFSGISDKARGASVGNEIFLSSLLKDMPQEVYGMIGHELSHVQLSQNLGVITFNRSLPRWFREGLAIYVSDGGGAPRNYEQETIAMFIEGKHFVPESTGSLFNRSLNSTTDIGPRMFYSQSGIFVTYLANEYPQKFQDLLKGLQSGNKFEEQFRISFKNNVEIILTSYISKLKKS
jgi:hypothetical protein